MRVHSAVFRLLAGISVMVSSPAFATIDFPGYFECKNSYEKNCVFLEAEIARREMTIFFDGTIEENGGSENVCGIRTAKLLQELRQAAVAAGAAATDVQISKVSASALGDRGIPGEYRCSYDVSSLRRDLRFSAHKLERRFWTNTEVQKTACSDDVRAAQAIPNSIGATKWLTATLFQGVMCNTHYALMGLDRISKDENGNTKILKFGSEN